MVRLANSSALFAISCCLLLNCAACAHPTTSTCVAIFRNYRRYNISAVKERYKNYRLVLSLGESTIDRPCLTYSHSSLPGFLGHDLKIATNQTPVIVTGNECRSMRRRTKRFIKAVYIINLLVGVSLLTYVTVSQKRGDYRCKSVTVTFGDACEFCSAPWPVKSIQGK